MNDDLDIYCVGGAVRDQLLGRPVCDRDWVVVGSDVATMLARGFKPVGRDFPVFLHPDSREEYALARTERKSAPGYTGFTVHAAPDVTLEQDLARRDLTINAMAQDRAGRLIDPYGGQSDLAAGVLRHVGPAFVEDPVRILRLARFAARFGFTVAAETLALMRQMVASGEVDALVPERVWQELARGLMEAQPSRMLQVLRDCGALARLLPELDRLFGVPQPAQHHPEIDCGVHVLLVVDQAAAAGAPLPVRWAALLHDLGKADTPAADWPKHHGHEALGLPRVEAVCARLKAPADCSELALMACREHGVVHRAGELRAGTVLELFSRCDGWRRPERFLALLTACEADARGRSGFADAPYPQRAWLSAWLAAARTVDAGRIASTCANTADIPAAIAQARLAAIATAQQTSRSQPA